MLSLHLSFNSTAMPIPDEITRAFASGATLLTANVRLARWLRREYALEQRRAGRRAWASPPIEDWDSWVRARWHQHAPAMADAPLLLTSLQERSVWTRMQREDASLLLWPTRMAALAESAYALLGDYEAHGERDHLWGKLDAESFRRWAASFDRECSRRRWISRSGLERRVAEWMDAETLPEEILLVGFTRTSPAQRRLLEATREAGARVEFAESEVESAERQYVCADGAAQEIEACAWWARELVEENPEARIGVLTPDMAGRRGEIEAIFRRVLMPQTDDIFAAQAMPFEFSLGQPLANVPVIRAAFLLLKWLERPLQEEEASWLLLSGFLSLEREDELVALAKLDARLRGSGMLELEVGLAPFLRSAGRARGRAIEKLALMQRSAAANRVLEEERLPGRWVDLTQSLLHEAGWPGAADRDRLHFQALRRWERALDDFAPLDFDGQRMGYGEFRKALEAHALDTIFSPESEGAPVQIMGPLEASGQRFDAVWFLSADDQSWPMRGRPHPLLPNDVQRRSGMPYSDAKADLELAKRVTEGIAGSAPVVVFSYAERSPDGEQRPSALLASDAEWVRAREWIAVRERGERDIAGGLAGEVEEIKAESAGIAWPQERSPGGSEVLKHQADCPFQAFATKRLHCKPLAGREWGFSAVERGTLLHKTLEKIWSPAEGRLHSLDDLQSAIAEGRLTQVVRSAIEEAFASCDELGAAWEQAYVASEQRRLMLLLEEWLRLEAKRAPFEVTACEEKLEADIGGLKLKLRVDRIDQLGDGSRLLIDYKSGRVSPRDWQPPRPREPQLPLYAAFGNVSDLRGVLFARIRAGDTCFDGSVEDVQGRLFADAKANSALARNRYTEEMREGWREALLSLAEEFLRGEAAVDPSEGEKTCRYCSLAGLCRVAEVRNPLEGSEEGRDDAV